jgi:D-lactate dehydrogenase (cytochrome)
VQDMIRRIDHVSIAVRDLENAKRFFCGVLGGRELYTATEAGEGFRWTAIGLGSSCALELIDPVGENSFLHRFLDRRGNGAHHVTFQVNDLDDARATLEARGVPTFGYNDADPNWKYFYVHPRDAFGVLLQFAELDPGAWTEALAPAITATPQGTVASGAKEFSPGQIAALTALVDPDRFSVGASNRELHARDISPHRGELPAGVIWPLTTGEVSAILAWCSDNDLPVTPWGAGSSLEGNPVPVRGGLVMDLTRMDRVLDVRPRDLQVDVQPGVLRKELNRRLGRHGLFFPPDPGADATIGGMIANNASGVQTVRYGSTRDNVMRLVVVLPSGDVIHTGTRAHKSSAGYDLTRLFVGSEGTLGVVTEATLKLTGLPAHHLAATVPFHTLEGATEAVAAMIGSGLDPAALELLTPGIIALMNREAGLGLAEAPSLFCEFHGVSEAALAETAATAEELCRQCGALSFRSGIDRKARAELWRARHEALETIQRAHPGRETVIVDVAVPISTLPEIVVFSQEQVDAAGVPGFVFGHAGDGNCHVVLVGDPAHEDEWVRIEDLNQRVVSRALELGGTCTGEHGVGIGKRRFMPAEHGSAYELMRQIKGLVDPKGILNPGKIFLE